MRGVERGRERVRGVRKIDRVRDLPRKDEKECERARERERERN